MKNYVSSHMVKYEEPKRIGFCRLPVLTFLVGHPWNQLALNFVHSLKPSCIRVVFSEEKTDSYPTRVTVYVDKDWIITGIVQEVMVGLDGEEGKESYQHAHDLQCKAEGKGIKFDANL